MAPKSAKAGSGSGSQKCKNRKIKSNLYMHVHLYENTKRWGAWVREPKAEGSKRVFLGTHLTEKLATRCQDLALLKMETDRSMTLKITLNFDRADYEEDEKLREELSVDDFIVMLRGESRARYNKFKQSACLKIFLAEEEALGNLSNLETAASPDSKGKSIKEELSDDEEEDEEFSESETDVEESQDGDSTPDAEDPYAFDVPSVVAPVVAEPLALAVAVAPADRGPAKAQNRAGRNGPPKWAGRRRRSGMATDDEMEVAEFMGGVINIAKFLVQLKESGK